MKFTNLLFVLVLIALSNSYSQSIIYSNSNTKYNVAVTSKLIEQLNSYGVTLSSNWQIDSLYALTPEAPYFKSVFTYGNDKVISNEIFIASNSSWVKWDFEINEYDENNNRILYLSKEWYNNEWQDYRKITFEYNDENNEIYSLSEYYRDSVWANSSRSYSDYQDLNYKETLSQHFENGLWQNTSLIKDYYGSGDSPEYSIWQIWNNNHWEDYVQIGREFNELNQLTYIAIELWQNGSFEFVAKVEYLYNGNDQIEKQNYYEKVDNNWELIYRQSYYYDENHNAVEIVNEDSVDGQWRPVNAPIIINFPHGYSIGYGFYKVRLFYSGISDVKENFEVVKNFSLSQNYPNPFNPITRIKYQVASIEKVSLKIYDMLGRKIKTLVNEVKAPGSYELEFDGSDLTSGVYFYVLETGDQRLTIKMLLLK